MTACADPGCTTVAARTTIDPAVIGSEPGWAPSMTVGNDGLPLIRYYRNLYTGSTSAPTFTGSDLMVARCTNANCSTATRTVADLVGYQGWYSSIAIGSDGIAVISYLNESDQLLKVAHCFDQTCSLVSNTTPADQIGTQLATVTSISIGGDGLPLITFNRVSTHSMRVVHCGDVACVQPLQAR